MEDQLWHTKRWPPTVKKTLDYPDEPLFKLLDHVAEKHPDNPSTIWAGVSRSFAKVRDHADRIANFLVSRGIKKGDRVAIFLPNLPQYPPIFFGILKTGAIAVTCNPSYTTGELNFQLKDAGVKAVFCMDDKRFTPTTYEAAKGTDVETIIVCSVKSFLPKAKATLGGLLGKIPKSPYYEEDKTFFYDNIVTEFEPKAPDVKINAKEDLALILYTGGTTGTPKGAMLTHRNLYANVMQIDEWIQLEPPGGGTPEKLKRGEDIYVGALPWYHSYGLTLTMVASYLMGSAVICIPDPRAGKPPLSELLADIQKYKGTVMHCVPALYAGMVNHPNVAKYDLSSIKACGSGAAPLPPELAKNFEAATGAIVFEGYGLTETSPMTHANPSLTNLRKFGAIGVPIPDTHSVILDMETGDKVLAQGETGEIAVHGPQVFRGYWNKPEETASVFREIKGKKYFLTGDIGHIDEDGFFVISDRKKDMVNVGGLKAYPREIEDTLYEHPAIAMAAAIGVPKEDDTGNEFVKAFVVLKEGQSATPEEIVAWAKEKLAGYKRPREVEIVDHLPVSTAGKVLRRELRAKELKKRGLA
ncbi:MAG: long-chain fatty acid--CoA ligase [Candidatus Thorarchaeota archaeon]|nr:long-chain fatty acid--CoA ligase [Candidatus Thorarchaeota archaeon]